MLYGLLTFSVLVFVEVFSLWVITSPEVGGLVRCFSCVSFMFVRPIYVRVDLQDFSSSDVGISFAVVGVTIVIFQLFIYPGLGRERSHVLWMGYLNRKYLLPHRKAIRLAVHVPYRYRPFDLPVPRYVPCNLNLTHIVTDPVRSLSHTLPGRSLRQSSGLALRDSAECCERSWSHSRLHRYFGTAVGISPLPTDIS